MWQAWESMTEAPVTAVTAAGEQRGPRVWKKREKWTETLYLESLVAPALTMYNHPQGKALRNSPQPGDKAAQFAAARYLHVRHFSVVGRALEGQAAEAALDVIARLCS